MLIFNSLGRKSSTTTFSMVASLNLNTLWTFTSHSENTVDATTAGLEFRDPLALSIETLVVNIAFSANGLAKVSTGNS
jgi:hypothetical protein